MSIPTKRPRKPPDIDPASIQYKELLTAEETAYLLSMNYRTVLEWTKRINPVTHKPWLKRVKNGKWYLFSREAIRTFIEQREAV